MIKYVLISKCHLYFKTVWGGDHFDAYFEILARFEYDNLAYRSNPFAHFKALMHERGVIDKNVYALSESKSLKEIKKALKNEREVAFDINDEQYEKLLKILKVPTSESEKYAPFFLDQNLMSKHWSVCNYFFKDTNKVFDIFNKKSAEFLLKKVKQPKTKLKFLKDLKEKVGCADPYDIQIKNGLPASEAEAWKQDFISIFSSTAKELDFTNAYCIQKIVADKYKALFGKEFVKSKAIKTKAGRDCYEFKFEPDAIDIHESLFSFRKKEEVKKDKFEDSDEED